MCRHTACVWLFPVFPNVNSLPRTKRKPAIPNRYANIYIGQCCTRVCRHVVFTLDHVLEQWIAIRHKPRKKLFQIMPHVRIRIFLNQQ